MKFHAVILTLIVILAPDVRADFLMRIGDNDGFGYGSATGFRAANGGPANRDGTGVLADGDLLPDVNRDGVLATNNGDDFDFRSSAEIANNSLSSGVGVTNTAGTIGSKFTDISLARDYDVISAAGQILIGGNPNTGLIRGVGGAFPSPPSSTLPNQPGFVFSFDVAKSSLNSSSSIFFNLIFADYDVTPAVIQLTKANNSTSQIGLTIQNSATSNGLIQAATASLSFGDVFTDGGTVWHGKLNVDFLAPNEPYTAFDYVELSTTPLVSPVPEPSSMLMAAIGIGSLAFYRRRRVA